MMRTLRLLATVDMRANKAQLAEEVPITVQQVFYLAD